MIVGEDFGKESNDRVLAEGNINLELQQTSHQRQTSRKRTGKYLLTDRLQIVNADAVKVNLIHRNLQINRFGNSQRLKERPANLNKFENCQILKYRRKPITRGYNHTPAVPNLNTTTSTS
jgi:hypothetical protein